MGVLTASNFRAHPTASAPAAPVQEDFTVCYEAAIRRSQDFLLSTQKPEGYWIGELEVDSTLVSDTLAFHHNLNDARLKKRLGNRTFHIESVL